VLCHAINPRSTPAGGVAVRAAGPPAAQARQRLQPDCGRFG